jgi:hypothetical protein
MAALFTLPRGTLLDAGGIIIPGGTVNFYNAGTTTPQAVYSDSGLTTPISQPVTADSAGRLPAIYLTTGSFKIVVKDAGGNTLYTQDNCDSGLPASTGAAVASLPDFFAATTEAAARTAIGAAAASDVSTLSSDVSAIDAQITAVGGTLGALAGLATVDTAHLATGYGSVVLQRAEVGYTLAQATLAGTIPFDDTIPQISEGTEVCSGSFTPKSGSSTLQIDAVLFGVPASSGVDVGLAIFQGVTANAIAAGWNAAENSGRMIRHSLSAFISSPGTSSVNFAMRAGANSGSFYVNGNSSGRLGGGIVRSSLRITEWLAI